MCPCCPSPARWSASPPPAAPEETQEELRGRRRYMFRVFFSLKGDLLLFTFMSCGKSICLSFLSDFSRREQTLRWRHHEKVIPLILTNEALSDTPSSGNLAPPHLVLSGSICWWEGEKKSKHYLVRKQPAGAGGGGITQGPVLFHSTS